MESLDELVTQAQALSSPQEVHQLLVPLQTKGSDVLSSSSLLELERTLNALDPTAHSLVCLFVLDALTSLLYSTVDHSHHNHPGGNISATASAAAEQIISSITSFISLCSASQIRLEPAKFCSLCRRLKDTLLFLGSPEHSLRGILPLTQALSKLQPTPEHLTPLHADALQLCLLSHCYSRGYALLLGSNAPPLPHFSSSPLPSLSLAPTTQANARRTAPEQRICEISPLETGVTQTDFLLFCYYGAMICIGMKKLDQGLRLLLHAISAPAVALSAITVESYKKFLLLSLILQGKVSPLPRYTPTLVQRQLKALASEYLELSDAYLKAKDAQALRSIVSKHEDLYKEDNNFGLVKQVLASVHKRSILRLTQTYLTLSLADIARTVKLESEKEAEKYILGMIEVGEIHASISQKEGMVKFKEDPEHYNTASMAEVLNAEISRTIELNRKLESVDNSLACDRLYLQRVHMREKTGRYVDPEEIEFGPSRVFESPM